MGQEADGSNNDFYTYSKSEPVSDLPFVPVFKFCTANTIINDHLLSHYSIYFHLVMPSVLIFSIKPFCSLLFYDSLNEASSLLAKHG